MTPGRPLAIALIIAAGRGTRRTNPPPGLSPACGWRGSVSGVCPEASRRPAGGSSPSRSGARLRTLRVSSLNLAGRPNAERCSDRPAFFGDELQLDACPTSRQGSGHGRERRFLPVAPGAYSVSAAAFSPCACAERRRLLRPASGRRHYSRRDVADALPSVAHRALLKSALRLSSAKTRRCASEAPKGLTVFVKTEHGRGAFACRSRNLCVRSKS